MLTSKIGSSWYQKKNQKYSEIRGIDYIIIDYERKRM